MSSLMKGTSSKPGCNPVPQPPRDIMDNKTKRKKMSVVFNLSYKWVWKLYLWHAELSYIEGAGGKTSGSKRNYLCKISVIPVCIQKERDELSKCVLNVRQHTWGIILGTGITAKDNEPKTLVQVLRSQVP
jgi:hypothetical protein